MHQEAASGAEGAQFLRSIWKGCGNGIWLAGEARPRGEGRCCGPRALEEHTIDRGRYERVKELFGQALDRPPGEREAFLARACSGEDSLREEVLELLRFQTDPGERLQAPVPPLASMDEAPQGLRSGPPASSPSRNLAAEVDDPEDEEPHPPLPKSLGDFEIRGLLGRGGMGVVYRATQREPRREVALKVLRPGTLSPQIRARFAREAEALRRLEHPGIARFLEAGTFETPLGQQPYFAMEYVEGVSLREHVQQHRLDGRQRLELLAAICAAVHHAHEQGIVHRDLKPENIFVDRLGQPRILDFGLARLQDSNIRVTSFRTGIGQLIGTIQYMSPEQASASPEAVKPPSDIYSLAVLGQELLTGRLPYELPRDNIPGAIVTIVTAEPVPAGDVQPTLRGDVEAILAKALEKDPADRYASAAAMAADIRRHLNRERLSIPRPGPGRRARRFLRQHRRLMRTALILGAVAAVAAGFLIRPRKQWTPAQIENELQVVYGLLMSASDNLHVVTRMDRMDVELPQKRQEIQASKDDLMRARSMLTRIPAQPFTADLRMFTAWSLGEAHYFLGRLDHDPDRLEIAGRFFRESASFRPSRPRFVAGMDPNLPIYKKIGLILPHHAVGGEAISAMALSRYRAPAYWLQRAATARDAS